MKYHAKECFLNIQLLSQSGKSNYMQVKQQQWADQWTLFKDEEQFLFEDWIYPNRLNDFNNKEVLSFSKRCARTMSLSLSVLVIPSPFPSLLLFRQ